MSYFPNKYDEVLNSEYSEVDVRDILNFSESWDLPTEFTCVTRVYWEDRVVERSFKNKDTAQKYIEKIRDELLEYLVYDDRELEQNELVECD